MIAAGWTNAANAAARQRVRGGRSASIPRVDALLGTCSLPALRRRTGVKWREYPDDVLPAFVAEMDFDLAEPVVRAVTDALRASDCGYPHRGRLGEAYASFAAARFGWAPDPALVYPIPDVMTGLAEIAGALTGPGAGIVVNVPVYPPFLFRFGFYGRKIIEAPLARDASGRYDLDPAAIEAAVSRPDAQIYLLCSPHNPTGNVWTREQLEMVADICHAHDVLVLVDEIHAPLVLAGARFVPFGSLDHPAVERSFVFTSATKGWNIPGLKCGLLIAGGRHRIELIEERWEAFLAAHMGVLASVAAFTEGVPWLDAVRGQLDQNRALLAGLLARHAPAVRYVPPQASFLAWLDCRELGLGDNPAATFLAKGKLAVSPGPNFGQAGRGYVRLNMGTSPDLLTEAVQRMAAAL
jgi:cysteine-S-conjugate beta-lyase